MSTARQLLWLSAARSHTGMVRKVNEDAFLELPEMGLWAVADGMGGHEAGDVASRMIVEALRKAPSPVSLTDFLATVTECLDEANDWLRAESNRRYERRTIGSTVAVLLAYGDEGACLWAGDSRIYRLRESRLQQLTRDHSHVQELIDQGMLRPEEANGHPLANVITRAVGSAQALELDVVYVQLEAGDAFLLCSDGLTKTVSDAEIAQLLAHPDGNETVQALIHLALVRGANDNVTTVVVNIRGNRPADASRAEPGASPA